MTYPQKIAREITQNVYNNFSFRDFALTEKYICEVITQAMQAVLQAGSDEAMIVLTEEMNTVEIARNLGFRRRVREVILHAEVAL